MKCWRWLLLFHLRLKTKQQICHKATVTKASRGCFFLCALTWLWTHLMTYWYGSMAGVFSGRGLIILLMCHYSMCLHGSFRRQRAAVLDESASGVCQTSLRQQRQGNTLTLSAVNRTQVQASGVCLCFCVCPLINVILSSFSSAPVYDFNPIRIEKKEEIKY